MKKLFFTLLIALTATIGMAQSQCHAKFYQNNNTFGTVSFADASWIWTSDSTFVIDSTNVLDTTNTDYIVSWNWNFGDGTSSNLQNPQHTYQPGLYTICLQITTHAGCTSLFCDTTNILSSNIDTCYFPLLISSNNPTNANADDGYAYVLTNDSAVYTYLWSNGDTGYIANNLSQGLYCVTVTNANGCANAACVNITFNQDTTVYSDSSMYVYIETQPSYSDSSSNCNGSATAIVSNNNPSNQNYYQYLWENGDTSQTIYNLCPGYYCVTVTNAYTSEVASACALVENYTNYDSTNIVVPTDTTTNYLDSCFITGTIDSAWVNNVYTDSMGVNIQWVIVQNGTTTTFTLVADINSTGTYVVILNITCNGFKSIVSLKDIITVTEEDLQMSVIENKAINNIKIYPNPALESINLTNCKNGNYELYNIQGMMIQSGIVNDSEKIDVSAIASGSYIIKIAKGDKINIGRFIK
ncbi:MAG: T9SS type A sorting domain-containing protein [Bacteroidota bacterium]